MGSKNLEFEKDIRRYIDFENCPYCNADVEIDHDGGYGYDQDVMHFQECDDCGKVFSFYTMVHNSYSLHKADCQNDGEHKWKPTMTVPVDCTRMICTECEEERKPTVSEWEVINKRDHGPPAMKTALDTSNI